jgi:hypothetical protein
MNGYLKQIVDGELLELYWFPLDIEEEIIKQAYIEYINLMIGGMREMRIK